MALRRNPAKPVWANHSMPRIEPRACPNSNLIYFVLNLLNLAKIIEKVLQLSF
jgi:hypothetical protein